MAKTDAKSPKNAGELTIEQLQQQVKDKDAQIAQLQQQIVQLQGQGSATSKLFQACYQSLVQGETEKAQATQKK